MYTQSEDKIWKDTGPLWMNNDTIAKIKKRKQALKRYLLTCDDTDYLYYTRIRNQAKNVAEQQ